MRASSGARGHTGQGGRSWNSFVNDLRFRALGGLMAATFFAAILARGTRAPEAHFSHRFYTKFERTRKV
jgi:hypothetical protein